jgi:hypothetical protein
MIDSSSATQLPSRPSDSSGLHSSSSSRESLAALVAGTAVSLASIAVLTYAWLATDRFRDAPWWAGPAAVAIAALPTSVRASLIRSIAARISPKK